VCQRFATNSQVTVQFPEGGSIGASARALWQDERPKFAASWLLPLYSSAYSAAFFRDEALRICMRARMPFRSVFETDQFSSTIRMGASGLGITLAPEMAATSRDGAGYRLWSGNIPTQANVEPHRKSSQAVPHSPNRFSTDSDGFPRRHLFTSSRNNRGR
jgi:DNA-binding transcriptional LysR family regulator